MTFEEKIEAFNDAAFTKARELELDPGEHVAMCASVLANSIARLTYFTHSPRDKIAEVLSEAAAKMQEMADKFYDDLKRKHEQ
jgi:hypothetical protein